MVNQDGSPSEAGALHRAGWIDATKGLLIILVAMFHATLFLSFAQALHPFWQQTAWVLTSLRMPLFFFVSGLLAAPILARSWSELLVRRVANLLWIYAIWVVIRFFFCTWFLDVPAFRDAQASTHFVRALYSSSTDNWFLYALAVFFVLARAARGVHWLIALVPAVTVSLLTMDRVLRFDDLLWTGMAKYFAFFLLGSLSVNWTSRYVATCQRFGLAWLLVPAWLAFVCWGPALTPLAKIGLVVALLAIPTGLSLGVLLGNSALLKKIGGRTLPVYLTNYLTLAVLAGVVRQYAGLSSAPSWLLVLAATALAVLVGLLLERGASATRLGFLFTLPVRVGRAMAFAIARDGPGRTWIQDRMKLSRS